LITGDPVPSVTSSRGGFAHLIRASTADVWDGPWLDVDLRTTTDLPNPQTLAGLVITGSASSVTERSPWILRGEEYLRRVVRSALPTLGICFGHQLLGTALGGDVRRNPRGREIGTVDVRPISDDALLAHARPHAKMNMTHVDSIVRVPDSAVVIAETRLDPFAAVRFSETTWGVQFHPEIDGEVMRHYIAARRDAIAQDGLDAREIHQSADDTPAGAYVLHRFVAIALR
jgi:GMP synthase (glutamine-hydrolysing)